MLALVGVVLTEFAMWLEGEGPYSNVLSQNFARIRAGSLREGLNSPSGFANGPAVEIRVIFRSSSDVRPPLD